MLSINFNTSKTDNYLCRLRTATALNLCEIQVIQINHDSIWEIFLVVQKMVYHILGVKVKNIYIFQGKSQIDFFWDTVSCQKLGWLNLFNILNPTYVVSFGGYEPNQGLIFQKSSRILMTEQLKIFCHLYLHWYLNFLVSNQFLSGSIWSSNFDNMTQT